MFLIIVGAGEIGYNLSKMLAYEKHDIVLIEQNMAMVRRAQDHLDVKVIHGSGSSPKVLHDAGIESADMLVAVTDNDEVNLMACMIANHFSVPKKVARVKNREFLFESSPLNARTLNIDLIIHPESEVAREVVNLLKQTAATDIIQFCGGTIQLIGIQLDTNCKLLGRPMAEMGAEFQHLIFRIVAIQRRDRTIIPGGSDVLMNGDRIFVLSSQDAIPELMSLTGKENAQIENVMILGGGQTGVEIAQELEQTLNVKIIESNSDKSEELADVLSKSLVISGDGRDLNLLALEGIIDMDAFISVTGDDETNIISCLMAKHLEVPRIISLINKTDYTPIIPTIGIDAYVSKQIVTVDNILKFIRRGSIVSVTSIPGLAAEVIEYIAQDNSRITRKPIRNLSLPKGSLLGIVMRGAEVFIPVGDSHLQGGDRVVVFALPTAIRDLEKLFN